MADIDNMESIKSWEQEKHQLEQEIINLSKVKDQLWSQKEHYKSKSILLNEQHINDLHAQQLVAVGEKAYSPKIQTRNIDLPEDINKPFEGSRSILSILMNKIRSFSSSLEKEMAPLILELEESTSSVKKAEKERTSLSLQIDLLKKQVSENSSTEEFLSQTESRLFEARDEIGKLLEKEDAHILEINNLKKTNSTLNSVQNLNNQHTSQVSELKNLLHKGAGDYEILQNKYSQTIKKNEALDTAKTNVELDCVKYKSKISGLEKILEKRDFVHAEKTGLLLDKLKDQDKQTENLNYEVKELSTHLSSVQEELYEERGKLEAALYTRKKLEKKLVSIEETSQSVPDDMEDENNKLHEENLKLNESLQLMELNIEELENRIEDSEKNIQSPENREDIKNQLSSIRSILTDSLHELKQQKDNSSSKNELKQIFKDDNTSQKLITDNTVLKEELALSHSNISKFELRIAYLEDETIDMTKQLKSASKDKETFELQLSKNKTTIKKLKEDTDNLKISQSDYSKELKQSRQISMDYSQELVEKKRQNSLLQTEIDQLQSQPKHKPTSGNSAQSDDLLLASPDIINSLIIMDDKIDTLEDSILLEGDRQESVKSNIAQLENAIFSTIESIETDLIDKEVEIIHLRDSLRELDGSSTIQNISSFEDEILDLKEAINHRESTINDLNSQLGKIETELLLGQISNNDHTYIANELSNIADGLGMMGLMKAADDIRLVISKLKGE